MSVVRSCAVGNEVAMYQAPLCFCNGRNRKEEDRVVDRGAVYYIHRLSSVTGGACGEPGPEYTIRQP